MQERGPKPKEGRPGAKVDHGQRRAGADHPGDQPCSSISGPTTASAQNSASRAPYQLPCPPHRPSNQMPQRGQPVKHRIAARSP